MQVIFKFLLKFPVYCKMNAANGMGARRHGQEGALPPLEMLKSVFVH